MKNVRFDGRGRLLAFDHEWAAGDVVRLDDDAAAYLEEDPNVRVTVLDEDDHEPEAGDGEGQPTENDHDQED